MSMQKSMSSTSKSTYIPPHLRKENKTQSQPPQKNQIKQKPIDEFPVLAPVQVQKK